MSGAGGSGGALSTAHDIIIFLFIQTRVHNLTFSLWSMFVDLQFFSLFIIPSLITTTVFRFQCFADCCLSTVCVYLQPFNIFLTHHR